MKIRTFQVLMILRVLAWVAFIGYLVEAGTLLTNALVTYINYDAVQGLSNNIFYFNYTGNSLWHYTVSMSFFVVIALMKSQVWFLVIKPVTKLNLENPFKMKIVHIIERISYLLFWIWIMGVFAEGYAIWLLKNTGEIFKGADVSGEFLFMTGLVYIISQVYKRGVELQSEQELTV